MASVSLQNITKVYGNGVTAVRDFSLEIADREFVVLVGPSGCGKTTTLRMIAGLEEITEGNLFIDGVCMNGVEPKDRDIAMVFQSYALYPHMTVYENMAFALKTAKRPKEEIDRKVREAAEILGITDLLQERPRALSGGQQQRAAIGRAIVRKPRVFLMDEPLSNLDARMRDQMRSELIKLRRRVDTTFIYVTHDQTEAMTLGDRIVVMDEGRIQQTGTPQEVYDEPANVFVAQFIGNPRMNLFDGTLKHGSEGFFVECLGARFVPGGARQQALSVHREGKLASASGLSEVPVKVGIRPEHIEVQKAADQSGPEAGAGEETGADMNGITGVLEYMEMLGSEQHLHVRFGEEEAVVRLPAGHKPDDRMESVPSGGDECFAAGDKVVCRVCADRLHLFDGQSGESLF